jgi:hypothetical protein
MADVFTGWAWNIGMFERAVIYPIMIGHVVLGSGLIAARTFRQASQRQLARRPITEPWVGRPRPGPPRTAKKARKIWPSGRTLPHRTPILQHVRANRVRRPPLW